MNSLLINNITNMLWNGISYSRRSIAWICDSFPDLRGVYRQMKTQGRQFPIVLASIKLVGLDGSEESNTPDFPGELSQPARRRFGCSCLPFQQIGIYYDHTTNETFSLKTGATD